MVLKVIAYPFSVCKVKKIDPLILTKDFFFISKTDEEISLVCPTGDVPDDITERCDGWRGFRIDGVLDFSLVGILSRLTGILADNGIGIFAVSTYNTDYILVKEDDFERSLSLLKNAGYET